MNRLPLILTVLLLEAVLFGCVARHPRTQQPPLPVSHQRIAKIALTATTNAAWIRLEWSASVGAVAGYRVYQSTNEATGFKPVKNVKNKTLSCTLSNLAFSQWHYFGVTAYDAAGLESEMSNVLGYNSPLPPRDENKYSNIICDQMFKFRLPYPYPPGKTNWHWDLQQAATPKGPWTIFMSNVPGIYSKTDYVRIMYPMDQGGKVYRLKGHQ